MTSDRWQHVESLLDQALDLAPGERMAFLHRATSDPSIRDEVASLLDLDTEGDGNALETHAFLAPLLPLLENAFSQSGDAEHDALPFEQVGPYRLLRQIGRGGMGRVFLAQREDVDTHVALKLLSESRASEEHRRRFLFERRTLARLAHPAIARFLDAGVTVEGRLYLVMEYVEGEPITAYCDRKRLPIADRLRLFETVCTAVQFAHGRLVVHRDLKPSNILVTETGTVKLLDFGIAKLLDDGDADLQTHTGMRLLTPAYGSPEQFRGEAVTVATDVYALGVVLYELLAGCRPYSGRGLSLEKAVLEGTVSPPSSARAAPPDVAALRQTTIDRLARQLQGDLDAVVLQALRLEAERRYASADALRRDIDRHLTGLPVEARRDTLGYRLHKFMQRHRAGVAIAAVLLLLVLAFAWRERALRQQALAAQHAAETESEKAQAVSGFLTGLFETASPFAQQAVRGDSVTVGYVLREGARRIETELNGQPAVQAQMMITIGNVYERLTRYDEATALLASALKIRQQIHGEQHLDVAEAQGALAILLEIQGDTDRAEALMRQALTTRRTILGSDHLDVASTLQSLGILMREARNLVAADTLLHQTLAIRRSQYPDTHPDVIDTMNWLAKLAMDEQRYERADSLYMHIIAANQSRDGNRAADLATNYHNLASSKERQGRYDEAETLYRTAVAMYQSAVGADHLFTGITMSALGQILHRQGAFVEAESLLIQSLKIREKREGNQSTSYATGLVRLSALYVDQQRYDEAEALQREALSIQQVVLGEEHWRTALTQGHLGGTQVFQQAYKEAETLLLRSHARLLTVLGEQHRHTRFVLNNLVLLYEAWEKPEQAASYHALQSTTSGRMNEVSNHAPSPLSSSIR